MADQRVVDPGTGFRTALALADAGVAMKRAQLAREFPGESAAQILARLNAWLRERPGAPGGDGAGRPVRLSHEPA